MAETLSSGWAAAAALNQWLLYGAVLFAIGAGLFVLWIPASPVIRARAIQRGRIAIVLAAVTYVLAIGLVGADIFGDPAGIFAVRAWRFGIQTTLANSAFLGIAAMALLLFGFTATGAWQRLGILAGIALAIGSFLVTGHPAVAEPRWLTTPAYAAHLLAAAFWLGALPPLAQALRASSTDEAVRMIAIFSRRAAYALGVILVSGLVLGAIHLGSVNALTVTDYGQRLIVKLVLAGLVFAVAAYNKFVLTPALHRGEAAAPGRLRSAIAMEIVLLVMVLGAAVALAWAPPPAA